ncbi:glycosyltransferase [bacterium]|nr:glycosyltransferase [bacterium]
MHNFPNILVLTAAIQKILGEKIILDVHDPMPELFRSKFKVSERSLLIRFLLLEERISTCFANSVIAANHSFRDILAQRSCPIRKIAVVLNTPDGRFNNGVLDNFNNRQDSNNFNILYIGTLADRYGLDTVLKAVAKIKKDGSIPHIKLSIIPKIKNEGDYSKKLLKEVHKLGLDDSFCLLNPVPHDQMPAVIRAADLSVYTPLPDVHMDIALSLKIPEVIAVGRPLVTSRLSGLLRYFGEDALFMCKPGNAEDCAAKIFEVYQNPEEARIRTRRAQEALARFDWGRQKTVYLELIREFA